MVACAVETNEYGIKDIANKTSVITETFLFTFSPPPQILLKDQFINKKNVKYFIVHKIGLGAKGYTHFQQRANPYFIFAGGLR
jgi:hypothetical protein